MKSLSEVHIDNESTDLISSIRRAVVVIQVPSEYVEATVSLYLDALAKEDKNFAQHLIFGRREDPEFHKSLNRAVREGMILKAFRSVLHSADSISHYLKARPIEEEVDPLAYARVRSEIYAS